MKDPVVSENTKSKILKVILPLLVIGLALVAAEMLLFFGPTVPKTAGEVKPTLVEVLTARGQDEQTVIVAYGTVQAHQRLIVQPEISDRVVKLNPRLVIGETLNKVATLLQIDLRNY